jgi:hypothetical protein
VEWRGCRVRALSSHGKNLNMSEHSSVSSVHTVRTIRMLGSGALVKVGV